MAARTRKPRAPRRRRMAKKPLVKMIKNVAAKVASSALETKYVTNNINAITFNAPIATGIEQYSCYPTLGPGTGTYQRLGISVNPVSCKNTWIVSLSPVSRSVNIYVDLFVLIDKNNRYYPDVVTSGAPQLFRTGNSSSGTQIYNGFNTDGFRMINQERYTLLKHFRFQLAANVGKANDDTTVGNAPNISVQSAKTLNYFVDCPKVLRYNPNNTSANYPNGHAPFWCLGYSHVDGTPVDVLNQDVTVSHITQMKYKDA